MVEADVVSEPKVKKKSFWYGLLIKQINGAPSILSSNNRLAEKLMLFVKHAILTSVLGTEGTMM